jgi:hypothetical protein
MANVRYAIIVSGEQLAFTRDQIKSDPGNYFETYFFGEFSEGARGARELLVEKDVQLFKLIQAHLRGYEIFPLPDSVIPSYMTREVALTNLLREAQFYGLEMLENKIHAFQLEEANLRIKASRPPPHKTKPETAKKYQFGVSNRKNVYSYEWSKLTYVQRYGRRGWVTTTDVTEEGYNAYLSKFLNGSEFQPVSPTTLVPGGYTISICWRDNLSNTEGTECALLASKA